LEIGDQSAVPTDVISNFSAGDSIDLAYLGYVSGSSTVVLSGDTLTITEGGTSVTLTLDGGATRGQAIEWPWIHAKRNRA
jgi:hypothetical protein